MENTTKYKLASSLKKILLKKDIDKITINEIAQGANVNRQRFYYHFKDIYDLIEWIYINEIIKELKSIDVYNDWEKLCDFTLNYILKNKKFISKTYKISSLENFIYNQIYNKESKLYKNSKIDADIDFKARFYSHAFIGIIGDWIKNGMKESPKQIITCISKIINNPKIYELDK